MQPEANHNYHRGFFWWGLNWVKGAAIRSYNDHEPPSRVGGSGFMVWAHGGPPHYYC